MTRNDDPDIRDLLSALSDGDFDETYRTPELQVPEGWTLKMTCMACPEQYDLTDSTGEVVAYFRLRHGFFNVSCPDVGGESVYSHGLDDAWQGIFSDDEERQTQLQAGIDAAVQWNLVKDSDD